MTARYRRIQLRLPLPPLSERFGIRSQKQLANDLLEVLRQVHRRERYAFGLRSVGLLRPDLSLPAYSGRLPSNGISPIFNFFDRTGGGRDFHANVTRHRQRDWRGGRLSYDEHDGTDFVCPPGTPVAAAAPGVVVARRDRWLRGGLTLCIDHGHGVVTQYTHLSRILVAEGQSVIRGELVAVSGHSGLDMTGFFPWVPPHVHFMVWILGRPVDPYQAPHEQTRPGLWLHGNQPETTPGPLDGDPLPPTLDHIQIHEANIERALSLCADPLIRTEMEHAPNPQARAALMEDSLHHDRHAWSQEAQLLPLRPAQESLSVKLTLPLSAELYRGACAADAPWTRP
jgi:murein DD-endopeptidase MepM/ murein hydrolase activator NlpD